MSFPHASVIRFFQLLKERHFSEAERTLKSLREMMPKTEWTRGYIIGLGGMILSLRSRDDTYVFLPTLDLDDEKKLNLYRREFLKQTRDKLHAEYDRGFFSSWSDFMKFLTKTKKERTEIGVHSH